MAPSKKQLKDEEDEKALQATSVTLPSESKFLFNVAGGVTSLIPAYLFSSILHLDASSNVILYAIFTIFVSQVLAYAYATLADNILQKRTAAVQYEASKKGSATNSVEFVIFFSVQHKANLVANHEASYLAIFYNNALFVFLTVFLGFFLFSNFSPAVNYAVTSVFAAGVVVVAQA